MSTAAPEYDILLRNGALYDGSGGPALHGDLAISGDRIAAMGQLRGASARLELDVSGLAVAPGFINMLSWACETLIVDGRSQSDIRQGVTLEVMGESFSYGPWSEAMKSELRQHQGDIKYAIAWSTLGEYLEHLEQRGVATNVASFVGSGTLRTYVIGYEDRPATSRELEQMCALVRQAMEEGAVGLASALIYVPDRFNRTEELIAMARAAAAYDGLYIAHLRSEGDRLLEGLEELISIARAADIRAEVYHLKLAGQQNWPRLEQVIQRIAAARAEGLAISADMYPYTAAGTGLTACMPPWVQEGGHAALMARLRDPGVRARLRQEMQTPGADWENMYLLAGGPEHVLLLGFISEALKPLAGKTLAEVAAQRGSTPEETIMDLVLEDNSRVHAAYFIASEANLGRQLTLPWVSLGSDAASLAPEGVFLASSCHPRAYGTFARFLGRYVRDQGLLPLPEAIRRLTSLPAANLRLDRRGSLRPGCYADVVVFDPASIQDHATYARPHQFASGVVHVFVNGSLVLQDGEHTGALPGRVVRGPGWRQPAR